MEISLTQRRKIARARRAKSETFLRAGAMRWFGGLGRIKKATRHDSAMPTEDIKKRERMLKRRKQRRNKQIGLRSKRQAIRLAKAEGR